MRMQEIKQVAKEMGIKAGRLRKRELIRAIQSAEGNSPCFQSDVASSCQQLDCCWRDDCLSVD